MARACVEVCGTLSVFAVIVDQIQVLPSFDVYKVLFRRGDRDSMIVPE